MHMDIAAVVMCPSGWVQKGLVSGEMLFGAKLLAQPLRLVYGQAVVRASRGSKEMI